MFLDPVSLTMLTIKSSLGTKADGWLIKGLCPIGECSLIHRQEHFRIMQGHKES